MAQVSVERWGQGIDIEAAPKRAAKHPRKRESCGCLDFLKKKEDRAQEGTNYNNSGKT
jgi:hypothetical protein